MAVYCTDNSLLKSIGCLLLVSALTACGGGGGGDPAPAPVPDETSTDVPRDSDQPEPPAEPAPEPTPEPEVPADPVDDTPPPEDTPPLDEPVPPVSPPPPATDNPRMKTTTLNYRLKSVTVDFDNNGTPDAQVTMTYDASGRRTNEDFVYSGDSAQDPVVTYIAKAANFMTPNIATFHMKTLYNEQGWLQGSDNEYSFISPPDTQYNTADIVYGSEGPIRYIGKYFDANRSLLSTTKGDYLEFANGLPGRFKYEYTPPADTPALITEIAISRDDQGHVVKFDRYNGDGNTVDLNTLEWNGNLIAKFETKNGNAVANLDQTNTIRFQYNGNCIVKEQSVSKTTALGMTFEYLNTATYTRDPATGRALYLELDIDSNGSIDARADFEYEEAPYILFHDTEVLVLDRHPVLEHNFYCLVQPSPL